jgi:hypothetical protein
VGQLKRIIARAILEKKRIFYKREIVKEVFSSVMGRTVLTVGMHKGGYGNREDGWRLQI